MAAARFQFRWSSFVSTLPVVIALGALVVGGLLLLERSERQARDTIRKHHLQDLEDALFFARAAHGTFPPYETATWCGELTPASGEVAVQQVEAALRQQHALYANPAKPFPTDPRHGAYVYWKHSPTVMELLTSLEADAEVDRDSTGCPAIAARRFTYVLTSSEREDRARFRPTEL